MTVLLNIAPYPVFPPTRGGAIAIHQANVAVAHSLQVRLISQGLRRSEWRLAFSGPLSWRHAPSYTEDRVFSIPSLIIGYASGQRAGGSMLSSDRTVRLAGGRVIREAMEQADIIQVEHPWQVPTIARWNAGRCPLVTVAHNAEAHVAAQLRRPVAEVRAIRRREIEALEASDAVIVFSDEDRTRLAELSQTGAKKLHVIPLGVDIGRLRRVTAEEKQKAKSLLGLEKKRVILFVGSLYAPNVEAVQALVRIADNLDRRDAVCVVAGRVGERFRSNERVLVTGEVEDMAPYFSAADIAVNPMKSGGGMQVKLLEFLAAGLPTITTPVGARGVNAVPGRDLVLTEIDGFADAVTALLKDEVAAVDIGRAGRKLVENQYTWDAIARTRVELYRRLMDRAGSLAGLTR